MLQCYTIIPKSRRKKVKDQYLNVSISKPKPIVKMSTTHRRRELKKKLSKLSLTLTSSFSYIESFILDLQLLLFIALLLFVYYSTLDNNKNCLKTIYIISKILFFSAHMPASMSLSNKSCSVVPLSSSFYMIEHL